jgi:hypothetical protein
MYFFLPEFELCEWLCNSPTGIPHMGKSHLTFGNGLEVLWLGISHSFTFMHIIACMSLFVKFTLLLSSFNQNLNGDRLS